MDTRFLFGPRIHSLLRLGSTLALIALIALPLTAQLSNPNQPPRIKVSGKVVNSLTGEPINHALVTFNGRETRFILTDDDGSFAVEDLSSEVIVVFSARRPGFYQVSAVSVSPKDAQNVLLKLTPTGIIVGRVLGMDEEPLEHAMVQLYTQINEEGRKTWTTSGGAQTDEDGRFRLPNLRAGSYLVSVVPSQNRQLQGEPGYTTVYFPNAPDRRSASPIRVSAGQQVEANFTLSPAQLFNITGKIAGPRVDGIIIAITEPSGLPLNIPAVTNLRDGVFQICGVPRGTYVIRANGYQKGADSNFRSHLAVTVTSDRNDMVLSLQPPISIPIVIRRETIEAGATPLQPAETGVSVRAIALDNVADQAYSNFEGPPEQGHLVLNNLDPGSYRVRISTFGDFYVSSASLAGTNLLTEPMVITGSNPSNPIEIVVRNDSAKIRATVRGVSGPATVLALPDRGEDPQPIVGMCEPRSTCYMARSLAPGNYTIYAFDRLDNVEYANRKALDSYSSKAAHLTSVT